MPSAMLTPMMSSLMATMPSPLQSPTQAVVGCHRTVNMPLLKSTVLLPASALTSQADWSPIDRLAANCGFAGVERREDVQRLLAGGARRRLEVQLHDLAAGGQHGNRHRALLGKRLGPVDGNIDEVVTLLAGAGVRAEAAVAAGALGVLDDDREGVGDGGAGHDGVLRRGCRRRSRTPAGRCRPCPGCRR